MIINVPHDFQSTSQDACCLICVCLQNLQCLQHSESLVFDRAISLGCMANGAVASRDCHVSVMVMMLPCRQLRDKYSARRRDVYRPGSEEQEGGDNEE